MFCPNCSQQLPEGARACPNCGQQFAPVAPQQVMPQQVMPQQAVPVPGKGLGIASMVLGIIAVVLGICLGWIGIVISVIALILGAVGLSKAKKAGFKNGMAVAGLVCSIIALVFDLIWVIAIVDAVNTINALL